MPVKVEGQGEWWQTDLCQKLQDYGLFRPYDMLTRDADLLLILFPSFLSVRMLCVTPRQATRRLFRRFINLYTSLPPGPGAHGSSSYLNRL